MDILKTLGIGLFLIGLVVLTVGPMFMMSARGEVATGREILIGRDAG